VTSYGATELRGGALDALYQGVLVTDARAPDNPIVYANDAFLELTGYRRDEIVGRNCRLLQGRGTDERTVEELRKALADDQPFFGQLLNFRRDGTPFWNALSIVPLHDDEGVTSHHLASQTDVTSLREAALVAEQHGRTELLD
jgi:PAS domain S-box-containing protein